MSHLYFLGFLLYAFHRRIWAFVIQLVYWSMVIFHRGLLRLINLLMN